MLLKTSISFRAWLAVPVTKEAKDKPNKKSSVLCSSEGTALKTVTFLAVCCILYVKLWLAFVDSFLQE